MSEVFITEAKKKIQRYSGVTSVYMFLHAGVEGVEFYAARRNVHFTREGK